MSTADKAASMTPEELIAVIERGLTADQEAAESTHRDGCRWIVFTHFYPCDCGTPSRVLAEVESKRRIVATFVELDAHPNRLVYAQLQQQWVALRAVMAALARPYLDQETP